MFKKIIQSPLLKLFMSIGLVYLAFKKVDILSLLKQLSGVKIWFIVVNIFISFIASCLVSYRWSLLVLRKPKIKDVLVFIKSSFSAGFYGLFFPTAVAGEALKWIIIDEKYPKIPKTKLLGSIILDRFIGMSIFVLLGTIMAIITKINGNEMPFLILLIFGGLSFFCCFFYVEMVRGNLEKIFKYKWFKKFENISELVNNENKIQVIKSVFISLISDIFWILQMWFMCWYFGTGLSIMSVFIYLPIISTILILPISIAGFGAREQLYLFFYGSLALSDESLLLASTFSGILGVMNCLLFGLVTLTPEFRKNKDLRQINNNIF